MLMAVSSWAQSNSALEQLKAFFERFMAAKDNQTEVTIHVLQGERPMAYFLPESSMYLSHTSCASVITLGSCFMPK